MSDSQPFVIPEGADARAQFVRQLQTNALVHAARQLDRFREAERALYEAAAVAIGTGAAIDDLVIYLEMDFQELRARFGIEG